MFPAAENLRERHPALAAFLALSAALLLTACVRKPSKFGFFSILTLSAAFLLYDLAALCFTAAGQTALWERVRLSGFLPLLLTAVYLALGFLHAKHIRVTRYRLTTEKKLPNGKLRVVQLSDLHPGTNMTIRAIPKLRRMVESLRPDLIVLTGDIFDENTRPKAFDAYCSFLTSLSAPLGVWYVYGNHDIDWHWKEPKHTKADIEARFSAGGIHILEDQTETVEAGGARLHLAGRLDLTLSGGKRKETSELLLNLPEGYIILLDHQPAEFQEAAEAGADLLLTGHTHGGQIFPLGWFSARILHLNEWNYGLKRLPHGCCAIVSSGMGAWGYPIRTEGKTEIVCVEVTEKTPKEKRPSR